MKKALILLIISILYTNSYATTPSFSDCVGTPPEVQKQKRLNCLNLCADYIQSVFTFDNAKSAKFYCESYPYTFLYKAAYIFANDGTKDFGVALRNASSYELVTIDCALAKQRAQPQIYDDAVKLCLNHK